MGSTFSPAEWTAVAIVCGILYLVFDAARYFAQRVSPVTLRRWSADPAFERGSRWFHYDARNLRLMSGTLLQIALITAFAATVKALPIHRFVFAAVVWLGIVIVWKLILAIIPADMGEMVLHHLIPSSHFFYYLFWPVLFPLRHMFERLEKQEQEETENGQATDEEVQAFIDVGEEEGILEGGEGKMVQSVVEFGDHMVRELMTPRIDVLAFDARRPLAELARIFGESKYSRIPIFQESIDAITGIVHVKEVFDAVMRNDLKKPVAELARPAYFVSETKKVSELLREFQSEHIQVAVVVDEFGGTAGIITIEDIVEDIVGEIADEHEEVEATVVDLGGGEYLVSGMLRVQALEEMLETTFSGDDYETVAGLIFTTLGRVPKSGTMITKNGFRFEVERADRRRIYRVRVSRDPEWQRAQEEAG